MGVERVFIAVKSGLCIGGVSLFSPGDKVSGVLEVVTTSEGEELEGIVIKCVGEAHVKWTEEQSIGTSSRSRQSKCYERTANTTCLDVRIPLVTMEGTTRFSLTQGVTHQFPFSFNLPDSMASSFEGTYGHVRYTLRALLFQEAKETDKKKKKKKKKSALESPPVETVIPMRVAETPVNLNSILEARKVVTPLEMQIPIKSYGWTLCRQQKAPLKVWLYPVSACIPGGTLLFNATLDDKLVQYSSLQLFQNTEYVAVGGHKKTESRVVEQWSANGRTWRDVPIKIPPGLVPSGSPFCPIINVTYSLVFKVAEGKEDSFLLTREWSEVKAPVKLLVGTIPLREDEAAAVPSAPAGESPVKLRRNDAAASDPSAPTAPPADGAVKKYMSVILSTPSAPPQKE